MNGGQDNRSIHLPAEVYSRIESRLKSSDFHSVDDYVLFVISAVEEFLQLLGDMLDSKRRDRLEDNDQLKATVISVLEML